jgi:alanine racemase
MDLTLVDVGQDGVKVGDEVVLIGRQGNETISADEIAKLEDTVSYEVICGIGKRVPRIYIGGNEHA